MKDYGNKYNFNIDEIEMSRENIIRNNKPFRKFESKIKVLENDSFYVIKNLRLDDVETKNVKFENKTYHENLKTKVRLNLKLFGLFFNNFYRDEFNQARRSVYLLFGIPISVGMYFFLISPRHPIRGLIFNVSILSAFMFFYFSLKSDFENLVYSNTPLGDQVKKLKNELALINVLNPAYVDK